VKERVLKIGFFEQPPPNGSAGVSPYRGVGGRARLLPGRGVRKMRFLKHAQRERFEETWPETKEMNQGFVPVPF
jgi:hypothetical protein